MIIRRNGLCFDCSKLPDLLTLAAVAFFAFVGVLESLLNLYHWLRDSGVQPADFIKAAAIFVLWWSIKPEWDKNPETEDGDYGFSYPRKQRQE